MQAAVIYNCKKVGTRLRVTACFRVAEGDDPVPRRPDGHVLPLVFQQQHGVAALFCPLGPFGHIGRFSFIQLLAGQGIQIGFGAEHLLLCFIQRQFGHGAFLKQFCVTVKICFFQIVFAYIFLVVGIKGRVIPFRVGVIRFIIRFRPVDLDVNIL